MKDTKLRIYTTPVRSVVLRFEIPNENLLAIKMGFFRHSCRKTVWGQERNYMFRKIMRVSKDIMDSTQRFGCASHMGNVWRTFPKMFL